MEHFLLLAAALSSVTLLSVAINRPHEAKNETEIVYSAASSQQK